MGVGDRVQAGGAVTDLVLSDIEVREMTGYARPTRQLAVLKELGIPARRRPDNSVLVMRMHCIHPAALAVNDAPKLKSQKR